VLNDLDVVVGTVLGDPPYCSGGRQQASARQNLEKADNRRDSWFLTDNMGTDTYLRWMRDISGLLFRLSSVGAHFYCFTDWRQYTNLVAAAETKGWALRNVVVWDKARGGAMGSFWRNNHEWIAVFSKGPPQKLPHCSFFNTWSGAKPQGGEHATVKPPKLVEYLASAGPGLLVDPWMGSGTTLVAAKELGRRAIGIEIEERYCEIAAKRLSQEVLPLTGSA
jgi:DNA modification methylase